MEVEMEAAVHGEGALDARALKIDLDKLPLRRLDSIDESGVEHFPPDSSSEEQRLAVIRRIDFSSLVEAHREPKKAKKAPTDSAADALPTKKEPSLPQQGGSLQGIVDSLRQSHQELTVIIDLIHTVEANDAVSVAGMQRPKQLQNEALADLAVSTATKLQCLRHLGRYLKQSAKTLEQQVQKETRFYGSLIRLQQNWKVKRQRYGGSGPGNESFIFDLVDNTHSDSSALSRPSNMCTVRIEKDSSGILAVQAPPKSCCSISLKLFSGDSRCGRSSQGVKKASCLDVNLLVKTDVTSSEYINKQIKHTHSVLRMIQNSNFEEQVFDMVNREAFQQSRGISVTGMREHFLQIAIDEDSSLCLSFVPSEGDQKSSQAECTNGDVTKSSQFVISGGEKNQLTHEKPVLEFPDESSLEIYLLHLFNEKMFKKDAIRSSNSQGPALIPAEESALLSHFCSSVSHRIFSSKVLLQLESVAARVPYLHLVSHPTWHSRISSWSLSLKIPQPGIHSDQLPKLSDKQGTMHVPWFQFHTKVIVKERQLTVMGEGSPATIGAFANESSDLHLINNYNCDVEDLPSILLQQVASQVIRWLHREALVLGINVTRDFLSLYFDLEGSETLCLSAHINPTDPECCISWWASTADHATAEDGKSSGRKFLGFLSLEALHSALMDLVHVCNPGIAG